MNSDDLELFLRVARLGSISRAALETGTNQSTVSRRIALLESELNARLFRRSGHGVTLSARGEQLEVYALTVERTLHDAQTALRESAEKGPARICIAAQPTIARMMFGHLGHALRARFPDTQIRFVEGLASQTLGQLSDGEVDLAMMYVPEHRGALQYDHLLTEGVCLITPPDYPLRGEVIDVHQLGTVPMILPSTHHGLRVLVENLAARHGFRLQLALECDGSISITKRLVLAGCGCTVLPLAAVTEEVAARRLKSYRLENPVIKRDVGIVWSKNRAMPEGLWEVSQLIRQCAAERTGSGAWPDAVLAATPDPIISIVPQV